MGGLNLTFRRPALGPLIGGTAAIVSGALVLIGWQFGIGVLRAPLPGPSAMVQTTATSFILCGASLLLQSWEPVSTLRAVLGKLLAVPVVAYSAIILSEYAFRVDLRIDDKLFPGALASWPVPAFPGRFAPNTATAFPLVALALMFLGRRIGKIVVSELLAVLTGLIALVGIIGYAYHVEALYSVGSNVQMALHTALTFAALSVGVFLARPQTGAALLLADRGPSGILSRRLLLSITSIMIGLGWLTVKAQGRGWVDLGSGTALLVVCAVVTCGLLVVRTARVVQNYEEERERATRALVRTEKLASVGRMAATVAHEINNPLAAVTNAIYLASLDPKLPPDTRRHIELADAQLRRVTHLTKQTLGFYREHKAPGLVDVSSIADEVLSLYEYRIHQRGISVQTRYHRDGYVWGISGELRQVLSNLVANSLDALPAGGRLSVRVSRCLASVNGSSAIRITVADNGAGIPSAAQAKIFEPFFTTKEKVGTGLGLWVSRDIVAAQRGTVRFRSVEGKGTVFCVFLPAHCAEEPKTMPVSVSA